MSILGRGKNATGKFAKPRWFPARALNRVFFLFITSYRNGGTFTFSLADPEHAPEYRKEFASCCTTYFRLVLGSGLLYPSIQERPSLNTICNRRSDLILDQHLLNSSVRIRTPAQDTFLTLPLSRKDKDKAHILLRPGCRICPFLSADDTQVPYACVRCARSPSTTASVGVSQVRKF